MRETKNITIRLPKDREEFLSSYSVSINNAIVRVIDEFRQIKLTSMHELKGVFTEDEWKFFFDSFNGSLIDGVFRTNIGAFIANCEDSEKYEGSATRWNVNIDDISKKANQLKGANIDAIYSRIEMFWNTPQANLDEWAKW